MATPPTLADILSAVLDTIQTVLYEIAHAVAENAGVIASVLVLGAITFMVFRYGTRIFRGVMGWFRGLF